MGVLLGTISAIGRFVASFVSASVAVKGFDMVLMTARLGASVLCLRVSVSTFLVSLLCVALAGLPQPRQVHSCFCSL